MTPRESEDRGTCSTGGSQWRLPVLLAVVLAAIVLYRLWSPAETPLAPTRDKPGAEAAEDTSPPDERVTLTVDFGNGKQRELPAVRWLQGMTVADLLGQEPDLQVVQKGSGAGTFLVSINDIANEDAAGRNWTYEVNGQPADRSFAVYELQPGDRVLWTFGLRR